MTHILGTVLFAKFAFLKVQFNDLFIIPTPPCLLMTLPAPCARRVPYIVLHCDVTEYNKCFTSGAALPRYCLPYPLQFFNFEAQIQQNRWTKPLVIFFILGSNLPLLFFFSSLGPNLTKLLTYPLPFFNF